MSDEQEGRQDLNSSSPPTAIGERISGWIRTQRHLVLAVLLAIGLVVFLASLQESIRAALWTGLTANGGLVALLLLFSLLALSLLWSAGQRLDAWLFRSFNIHGRRGFWLDAFMWGVTQIGNGLVSMALPAFLYWIGYTRQAAVLVLGTLTLWLVVETIKAITRRSRPFMRIAEARIVGWRERGKSFPSGHTSQTFFIMSLLVHFFHLPPLAGTLLYGLAFLVGFTRIYVGAHYPRDVLAGALLGQVWGILSVLVGG